MKVNSEIFRAYDIRGTYKDQLSPELIFKIGQAIGSKILLANSNKIYVIDSGKVVDSGKHEDLMSNSKLYKNFYEKQIQK